MLPTPHRAGFTLVETLVGLAVLMSFFAAAVVIFSVVLDTIGRSRLKQQAVALAVEHLELVRNLSYDDIGTVGGIPAGVLPQSTVISRNGQDYTVRYSVVYIDDAFDGVAPTDIISTDYKRVRVEVSWGGPYASVRPVTLLSDAMPDGLESMVGGGVLFLTAVNSVGTAVGGASVRIVNNDVAPAIDLTLNSDTNGRVILPGAPVCNLCYQISVTRSGYSSDQTYSSAVVANPLKPHATVIEGEVTSLTFAIDQTSTLDITTTGPRENNYPPFSGVQFTLTGSKSIGTDTNDTEVKKYRQVHSSGAGGRIVLSGLEWDTYTITIPNPSSVDLAGTSPVSPLALAAGATQPVIIVTTSATSNNLLFVALDIDERPIATTTATLRAGAFIATQSAGVAGRGDVGQGIFKSLSPGLYTLTLTHPNYLQASGSVTISGDTKSVLLMERP